MGSKTLAKPLDKIHGEPIDFSYFPRFVSLTIFRNDFIKSGGGREDALDLTSFNEIDVDIYLGDIYE